MKMEFGRKKTVIIIAAAVVAVSAIGGSLLIFSGDDSQDRQQPRGPRWVSDSNLPNPQKQEPAEIIAYIDSDKFKQLQPQQKMNYFMGSGPKVMEYQMDTYASLPGEEKTAYLDEIIDRMEEMRPDMEQFRQERRAQRELERQNNPDAAQQERRRSGGGRGTPDPSRMRARRERGTPEQHAIRRQFFTALRNRAEQRGVQMPGPGGGR